MVSTHQENRSTIIDAEQLGSIAERGRHISGAPGIVAAVADAYGGLSIAAAGASSLAKADRMLPEKRFAVGSISKTVAAVVVHQLVREGCLDLSKTPGDYLSASLINGIAHADVAPLESLLNHTSGIYSWEFSPQWIRRGRGDKFKPKQPFSKTDTLEFVRGRPSATGSVGDVYSYSNTNHTLLGLIVEEVTGHSYEEEARRRVFDPNGLSSFAMESFEPIPAGDMAGAHHLATPFFRKTAGVHPNFPEVVSGIIDTSSADLSPEWSAGGFVAGIGDLARYGSLLMNNQFGDDVGHAMRAFGTFVDTQGRLIPRRVGLGLFEYPSPDGPVAGHFGGTLGYCAALLFPAATTGAVLAVGFNLGRMHTAAIDEHRDWQRWIINEAFPEVSHFNTAT